jgi:ribosomal protein L29
MGQTTNVKLIRNKRKDLARMLTVLGEALSKEAQ